MSRIDARASSTLTDLLSPPFTLRSGQLPVYLGRRKRQRTRCHHPVRQVEPPLVATMNSLSGYRVIRVTALFRGGHGRRQTIEDIEAD